MNAAACGKKFSGAEKLALLKSRSNDPLRSEQAAATRGGTKMNHSIIRKGGWACDPSEKLINDFDNAHNLFPVINRDGRDWYVVHAAMIPDSWDEESKTYEYVTVEVDVSAYERVLLLSCESI